MKNAMMGAAAAVFSLVLVGPSLAQDTPTYLTGGHLVDVVRGEIYEDIGVLMEDGDITGLFFDFDYNDHRIPEGTVRVDVSGKYLIPGLFDVHAHAGSQVGGIEIDLAHYFRMFLAGGVTTVRTLGNMEPVRAMKTEIDAGRADGPNIVIGTDCFEQAPGFPKVARCTMVNTPREAREFVRDAAYQGADWIKFYNYGDEDVVRAVVEESHKHGRKVTGHFAMLGAAEASRLGVDSLEHTVALLQGALDYDDAIAMTDIGYYRLFFLWPRLNQEKLDAIFEVLVENGTVVVPTLTIQNVLADPEGIAERSAEWFDLYQSEIREAFQAGLQRVPPVFNFSAVQDEAQESIREQARQMARFVSMGGIVAAGSDLGPAPPVVPGLSIHQELEYFVEGGMTPLQALRTATIVAAELIGWEDRFGSIEVGKQADIVALDRNPLADITALSEMDTVVKAGKVIRINALKDELRGAR